MILPWSDGWFVEKNMAWFIPGSTERYCAVFEYDFITKKCTILTELPNNSECFRPYSGVIKCGEVLVCLPDISDKIALYDKKTGSLSYIHLKHFNTERVGIREFSVVLNDKLYVYSHGLKKVLVLDLKNKCISMEMNIGNEKEEELGTAVFVNEILYVASHHEARIYGLNVLSQERFCYNISNVDRIDTFGCDGNTFWICGDKRAVYMYKKGNTSAVVIDNFSETFGICNHKEDYVDVTSEKYSEPLFLKCCCMKDKVFFVPFKANTMISVDIEKLIIEETEKLYNTSRIKDFFSNALLTTFLFQYVREERFIGVYWLIKNKQYEYDTITERFIELDADFDNQSIRLISTNVLKEDSLSNLGGWIKYVVM